MRNETSFRSVLLTAAAYAVLAAGPTAAQENESAESDGVDSAPPGDIIVTARRTEERLQDVPISITVFNQEQLNNRNIVAAKDLVNFTPSLSVNTRYGPDRAAFSIRGFTQEERTTPSVGVYFADVVSPRSGGTTQSGDGAGPGSYFDLQNVQVLKGPQGTLFGRNTTGGAIVLVPRRPTDALEGYIEGSIGNYDMRRVQGVLNLPLSGTFRVRLGADWQERRGYLKNVSGVGPRDFADIDYVAARLSVVGDLTDDVENYTIISYSNSTPNGTIPKLTDCYAGSPTVFTAQFVCQQLDRERAEPFNSVSNYLPNASQSLETWQIINTTTWQVSDELTIKNIASYGEQIQDQNLDIIGLGFLIPETVRRTDGTTLNVAALYPQFVGLLTGSFTIQSAPGLHASSQSTFTEELQLQGNGVGGRLDWQAGVYFEKSDPLGVYGTQQQGSLICSDLANLQCQDVLGILNGRPIGATNLRTSKTSYRSIGLYGQAIYDLTEQLRLTAGLRYTWDQTRSLVVAKDNFIYAESNRDQPVRSCADSPVLLDCSKSLAQDSQAPTWLIGLDYKPTPDVLLYAKWARGYRQGSTGPLSVPGREVYDPEKVDTYEVGAKATFRGPMPGYFNIAAFYNDFRDQQLKITYTGIAPVASNLAVVNAGKSRIYGLEVEASISPFSGLTLEASYAYLNSKLLELDPTVLLSPDPTKFAAGRGPVVGGRLPFTPDHKLVLSANYTLPVPRSLGIISVGATYTYTSDMFYQVGATSANHQTILEDRFSDLSVITSNQLMNAYVIWKDAASTGVDLQAFVTNLTNERYFTAHNISPAQGFVLRYVGEPRTYGLRARYNF